MDPLSLDELLKLDDPVLEKRLTGGEVLLGVHHLPIPRPYVLILKKNALQRYSLSL